MSWHVHPDVILWITLLEAVYLYGLRAVGRPRGFAVQARVVARGPGCFTAYKEPSGPGVRVDTPMTMIC